MAKKKVNERISDALNIEHEVIEGDVIETEIVHTPEPKQVHLEKDYTDVRDNLKDIIDKGTTAIDGILSVASEGESPRAYEVVSQLIKSVSEANKDLISLHKQIKDIKKEDVTLNQHNTTNQSIFVGSTKDLQALVKKNVQQIEDMNDDPS